jgi:putative endonuclease
MEERRRFGNEGEEMAAVYLERLGYDILARQYRTMVGEIDLIARDGSEIVFVEVKTRHGTRFGFPEESVTPAKLRKIQMGAEFFLEQKGWYHSPIRVDILAILLLSGHCTDIQHFKGIDVSSLI